MTIRRRRGNIFMAALVALTVSAGAAPALAAPPPAPPPTTSGAVGAHHLVDSSSSPGARCHYQNSPNYIDRIRTAAPEAKAHTGKSSQTVGFRVVVQGDIGAVWHNLVVTDFQKRAATSTSRAAFTARSVDIKHSQTNGVAVYRVRVDLRWYSSSGKTVGKATMYVANYLIRWDGNTDAVEPDWCSSTTG